MTDNPFKPESAEARTAIRRLESARPDLLIFEIDAKLHTADMRFMGQTVSQAMEALDRIDILLLIRQFEGATPGALFEPTALKAEAASITGVRRYVVVGAPTWAEAAITLGGWLSPVESKTFDAGEENEARAWIDRR